MAYKKYKGAISLALGLGIYVLFLQLSGIHCPIRFLFGVSCLGCGMSRACISAICFDFSSAFEYNPCWVLVLPLGISALSFKMRGRELAMKLCIGAFCLCLALVYGARLYLGGDSVVSFEPQNGVIFKLFRRIFDYV